MISRPADKNQIEISVSIQIRRVAGVDPAFQIDFLAVFLGKPLPTAPVDVRLRDVGVGEHDIVEAIVIQVRHGGVIGSPRGKGGH